MRTATHHLPALCAFFALLLVLGGCSDPDSEPRPEEAEARAEGGSRDEPASQPAIQKKRTTRGGAVENIDSDERRQAIELRTVLGPVQKEVQLYRADVRSAFEQQNFEWLEQEAESLRASEDLMNDGTWKLHHFYEGIAGRW